MTQTSPPRRITATYLESLKPGRDNGEIIVDAGVRGHGSLVLRVTETGKPLYYRYFHGGRRRFELIGYFDPKGSRRWRNGDHCFKGAALTLAAARDGFRELAQLAESVGDLKSHYAAEEARKLGERRKTEIEARAGTFGDLLTVYADALREAGKPSAKDVAGLFKRHVEKPFPQITKRRANTITPEDIQAILARLVDRGVTRGVNITRSYLRAAFSYAGRGHDLDPRRLAQDGKKFALTGNPVDLIPRIASFERVGERVLDADEMRKYVEFICDPAKVPNPITRAALQMHVYTGGQRVRQLLSAPWSAYDRDGGTVTLIDMKGRAEPREHVVPLVPEALAILEVLHEETGTADWPFTTNGKTGLRHETLVKAVAEVRSLEEGGIRAFSTPFTLKDIRRTVETTLASLGVSKEHRAQLLSHGRGDKIAQAYDKHNYLDEKRRALETWLGFLQGTTDAGANVVPMRQAHTG